MNDGTPKAHLLEVHSPQMRQIEQINADNLRKSASSLHLRGMSVDH
jgi:hypothetical protein